MFKILIVIIVLVILYYYYYRSTKENLLLDLNPGGYYGLNAYTENDAIDRALRRRENQDRRLGISSP